VCACTCAYACVCVGVFVCTIGRRRLDGQTIAETIGWRTAQSRGITPDAHVHGVGVMVCQNKPGPEGPLRRRTEWRDVEA